MKNRSFIHSIKNAVHGLVQVAKEEPNFQIQLFIGLFVVIAMIIMDLASWERILLILMTSAVFVLEIFNTVLERLSDALKPRLHPMVKEVKDMMAGAVLLTAITAVTVAVFIFSSYLFPTG